MAKTDGYVNWVEPKGIGFLPKDLEKDALSVLLRLLIGKVKEEHAQMQYRKELKHYGPEIIEIIKFARSSGYKTVDIKNTKYEKAYNIGMNPDKDTDQTSFNINDGEIDLSKIIDG